MKRYGVYNMHGPTVYGGADIERILKDLLDLNRPSGNAGPYYLVVDSGLTLRVDVEATYER